MKLRPLVDHEEPRFQGASAIIRNTCLGKREIFEIMYEFAPFITDEELQEMWSARKERVQ